MAEPVFVPVEARPERRPFLGYAMVMTAATLWAVNGTVSKVILTSGLSSQRLAEVRSTGAFGLLAIALLILNPRALRLRRREVPYFVLFGGAGLALVQWLYFVAIRRLEIGIALLIQYLAPVIVALWARYVFHEPVRRRIWVALALALAGLAFVVEIWSGLTLDAAGVSAALAGAGAYALYLLLAEHRVGERDPISLVCFGFLFASILWAVAQPWWGFPFHLVGSARGALLGAGVVTVGTLLPFTCMVAALRLIPAPRAAVVATLEPVLAAVFAWLLHGEVLAAPQVAGGAVVLAAVVWVQAHRPDVAAESAPPGGRRR